MNALDLVVVVVAAAAAVGGYRIGFVARVTSWIGMGALVWLAISFLDSIVDRLDQATPNQRFLIVVGTLLGAAAFGQGIGLLVGRQLHVAMPLGGARQADRVAGAVLGVVGVTVLLWLVLPIMSDVRGWMALQARTSAIAERVTDVFPDPPNTVGTLKRLVGDSFSPNVFGAFDPAPKLGPPPAQSGLSQEQQDVVVRSTLKVEGIACRRIQEGSGWVVAEGLVVTNAHVVAGEDTTTLQRSDGSEVKATVVAFDPDRDIAVLQAPGLDRPALPRAKAELGDVGAVFGHPGGGPLRVAPFEVGNTVVARGTDIYDSRRTERDVLVLASDLHPGDSGAALVDPEGQVVGIAFAIAPDKAGVAYALALSELDEVLAGDLSQQVDTGPCLT